MNIGKLRNRIVIQKPVTGTDPFNAGTASTWDDVFVCWAGIDTIDPRAVYSNGLQNMKVSHVITIRYPGSTLKVGPGYQVAYKDRIFSVVLGLINEQERNVQLQIFATEINPTQ